MSKFSLANSLPIKLAHVKRLTILKRPFKQILYSIKRKVTALTCINLNSIILCILMSYIDIINGLWTNLSFPFPGLPSQVVAPHHLQAPGKCTIFYHLFYSHLFNRWCHHWSFDGIHIGPILTSQSLIMKTKWLDSSVKMSAHEHCNFSTVMPQIWQLLH